MAKSATVTKIADRSEGPALSFATHGSSVEFAYDSLEDAFPSVDPGRKPFGNNVLIQVRQPKTHTKGGIVLSQDARDTEYYNTRVGKVVAVGPLCFSSTHTYQDDHGNPVSHNVPWPEGAWFEVGSYVEIPQYGGQRIAVPFSAKRLEFDAGPGCMVEKTVKEEAVFAFFKAKDIIGLITVDPRTIKSYAD